jgi:hypothetical protein
MKIEEITLDRAKSLQLGGHEFATIERRDCRGRDDCLAIWKGTDPDSVLVGAVDVSEQIDGPRVFSFEGARSDLLMLFGGENAYWIGTDGKATAELALFRTWGNAEYWTTTMIEHNQLMIIIYEAGVLIIDRLLDVVSHKPKYFNDVFVDIKDEALTFVRDNTLRWSMLLRDGSTSAH